MVPCVGRRRIAARTGRVVMCRRCQAEGSRRASVQSMSVFTLSAAEVTLCKWVFACKGRNTLSTDAPDQSCEQTERRNDWAVKMSNTRLTDAAELAEWTTYDTTSRQKCYALKDTNITTLIVKRPSAIVQKYCVVLQQWGKKQNARQCLQWLCTDNNKKPYVTKSCKMK